MRLPPPEEAEGLNMTPIIDVVFLLLIFFLVATRFGEEEKEIATRLAEVAKAQPLALPPNEVIVNVTQTGQYVVVGKTLGEEALAGFLHDLAMKNPGTQTVQIRADDRVPFRFPARIMGLCERERIQHYCTVVQAVPDE
jgi:biopolymer transport protein ExbD